MAEYTTVQAARKLGIGRDTIYRWMRSNKIKGARIVRVGGQAGIKVRLWTDADLAAIRTWMKESKHGNLGRKRK